MRLLVNQAEACEMLGIDPKTFRAKVRPYIKHVPVGSTARYPVSELERWVLDAARCTL